jgi:hypothetical protein
LTLPGITYDLSEIRSSKSNYLKMRPGILSNEDSIAYHKSFDEHIHDMQQMYLLLKNDSTYETNAVLESKKIQTGRFFCDSKAEILIFSADSNSISTKFRVVSLNGKSLRSPKFCNLRRRLGKKISNCSTHAALRFLPKKSSGNCLNK